MAFRSSNRIFIIIFCLLLVNYFNGQTRLIITSVPSNTPENAKIFVSGDFEGWTGGQEKYALTYSKGSYSIDLPQSNLPMKFKFTRGSWDKVEVDSSGSQIDNRIIQGTDSNDQHTFIVENWSDLAEARSTANEQVSILDEAFEIPELKTTRRIWVYLPPDYKSNQKDYPVLYMNDGQNLFDELTSYGGEWQVDESLDELSIQENINLIIVGIDNAGNNRIDEYTPWKLTNYKSEQKGEAYVNFIVESLKPYIDNHFRTLKGNEHTGIMGSSLGGLISHYAVLKHPDVFGKAGIFSPSFEMAPESFQFTKAHCKDVNSMLYFVAGDAESKNMASYMTKMVDQMELCGYPSSNIYSKITEGGEHNEKLWRDEFKEAIRWLYGKKQ